MWKLCFDVETLQAVRLAGTEPRRGVWAKRRTRAAQFPKGAKLRAARRPSDGGLRRLLSRCHGTLAHAFAPRGCPPPRTLAAGSIIAKEGSVSRSNGAHPKISKLN